MAKRTPYVTLISLEQWSELQSTNTSAFREVAAIGNFKSPNEDVDDEVLQQTAPVGAKLTHNTKCVFCDLVISYLGSNQSAIKCPTCGGVSALSVGQKKYWTVMHNNGSTIMKLDVGANLLPPEMKDDQIEIYLLTNINSRRALNSRTITCANTNKASNTDPRWLTP